jgi:hypothetical protein
MKKMDYDRAVEVLGDEFTKIYDHYKYLAKDTFKKYNDLRDSLYEALKGMFNDHECEVTNDIYVLKGTTGVEFCTQGWGKEKYAKNKFLSDYKLLEILGYKPEIKEDFVSEYGWNEYTLMAHITPDDFQILNFKGEFISVSNWAVLCWKNGVNPKVYFPYLNQHDYDLSQKLAYSEYQVTKENMKLEPKEA